MNYEEFATMTATRSAPDDSWIVLADVRGSTLAVDAGRYREVNLVGAACIAAIRNRFDTERVPYVFGGDGATFLVRDADLSLCLELLQSVQSLARDAFSLNLGVGHLQIAAIKKLGGDIHYGFLRTGPTEVLPFFRGHGLALAEKAIKAAMKPPEDRRGDENPNSVIEGLSCRLMPFAATRGRVLSLMIEATVDPSAEDAIFAEVFAAFKRQGSIERFRPLTALKRSWFRGSWIKEARLFRQGTSWSATLKALFASLLATLITTALFRFKWKTKVLGDVDVYTKSMLAQSDWMKMDGVLRMVIDATSEEEKEIRLALDALEAAGKVVYGIFTSKAALMTCYFQSATGQRHAHFIDGSDGGLTLAAKQLKSKKLLKEKAKAEGDTKSAA